MPRKKAQPPEPKDQAQIPGHEPDTNVVAAEPTQAQAQARAPTKSKQELEDERLKKIEGLRPNARRIQREEEVVNHWAVTVQAGVTRDMPLEPRFWAHIAAQMKPYDEVSLRRDDGTLLAHYVVLASDRQWARVEELSWRILSSDDISMTQAAQMARSGYVVAHRGPHLLWCVLRKTDNSQLSAYHQQEKDAENWITNYIRTVGMGL